MTKTELLRTIRLHCLDCCCGSYEEVKECGCPTCNLFPLRFGKDPTAPKLSPEERERRAEILRHHREKSQETKDTGDAS